MVKANYRDVFISRLFFAKHKEPDSSQAHHLIHQSKLTFCHFEVKQYYVATEQATAKQNRCNKQDVN